MNAKQHYFHNNQYFDHKTDPKHKKTYHRRDIDRTNEHFFFYWNVIFLAAVKNVRAMMKCCIPFFCRWHLHRSIFRQHQTHKKKIRLRIQSHTLNEYDISISNWFYRSSACIIQSSVDFRYSIGIFFYPNTNVGFFFFFIRKQCKSFFCCLHLNCAYVQAAVIEFAFWKTQTKQACKQVRSIQTA